MKAGNPWAATGAWLGTGVALALVAWLSAPGEPKAGGFHDEGQPLFPDFADPNAAASIEIIKWDEATGTGEPFKVEKRGHVWLLASHQDYPAEAKDRLVQLAGRIAPLKKGGVQSLRPEDHESLGVKDPLDTKAASPAGMGMRVTLRDEKGALLADMILGKKAEREGIRYVRLPEQKAVYQVKTDLEPSAEFHDWIEPDLLKLSRWDLRKIEIDNYRVDEAAGAIVAGEKIALRQEQGSSWKVVGMAENEEMITDKLDALQGALDDLKIVDVLRKPEQVVRALRGEQAALTNIDQAELRQKGFFLLRDGGLVSNEGELRLWTDKGVLCVLRFGELAPGGKEGEERRYVFVTARFDETALPEPEKAEEKEAWKTKVEEGKKKAEELTKRFAEWFYIIPGAEFKKTRLKRPDLVRMNIKLWDQKREEVAQLSVARPEWGLALALARKENDWTAELPPGPAVKARPFWVDEALGPATSVVARRIVENADAAAAGLTDETAVRVTLGTQELKIGNAIEEDRYVSHGDKVYRVEATRLASLLEPLGRMVELKLFGFKAEEAASLTIHTPDAETVHEKEKAADLLAKVAALGADDVRALGKVQDEPLTKAERWVEVAWTDAAKKKLRLTVGGAPPDKPHLRYVALSDRPYVALVAKADLEPILNVP